MVCEPHIRTEKQARAFVEEWLGFTTPALKEDMDWDQYAHNLEEKAKTYVRQPEYDPLVLERMNKTLIHLGYCPVFPVNGYSLVI